MDEDFLFGHWYADIYEQRENDAHDIMHILSTLGNVPQKILEVACGGGRILEPIARAGHTIEGFDMDMHMLKKCEKRINGMPNATCNHKNAVNEEWGHGYDVVIMGGNLLVNIVSDMEYEQAQRLLINKASLCLVEGGRLYLEFDCKEHFLTYDDPAEYIIFEGKDDLGTYGKFTMFDSHDNAETRISESKRRIKIRTWEGFEADKEWDVKKHFPTYRQVKEWLENSGFIINDVYGDFNHMPISDKTNKAVIWAEKP